MEASISNLNSLININSSSSISHFQTISPPLISSILRPRSWKKLNYQRLCCVKLELNSVESERKLKVVGGGGGEEEDWMMELGEKWCEERRGMVEIMECLEKEAIMGEDEGREAVDYHRRAQIFDKSSRVFQDLKEHSTVDHV